MKRILTPTAGAVVGALLSLCRIAAGQTTMVDLRSQARNVDFLPSRIDKSVSGRYGTATRLHNGSDFFLDQSGSGTQFLSVCRGQ
jgi:hypothetical protein